MQHDRITPRQFTAAAFVAALSPLARRFPRALAAAAGHGAWLAVPLSAAPMLALLLALWLLFRRRGAGTGLAEILADLLGPVPGRLLTGVYGLWFLFYAGFLLRSGAERFIATVYNGASPALFVVGTALLCAPAAAGRALPLARTAMLLRPLMCALFLLVALLTAKDLDVSLLLPLTGADVLPAARAALETANILSLVFCLGFLGDRLDRPLTARDAAPWLGALLAVIALMTVGCLGMFGAELTAKMRYPYFMLVRDLSVLGALERVEPVVVALWVFPDFLLVSLLLHMGAGNLRLCFSGRAEKRPGAAGRWLPLGCAAAAAAIALALPGSLDAFRRLSERTVPLLSAAVGFGLLPPLLLLSALRRRRTRHN